MKRFDVVEVIAKSVTTEDLFVTSVGGIWDDWWNMRPGPADNTFSMGILGSVTPTALGLALALPHRRIVAFDTDGSLLLNVGALCTVGASRPPNLTIIVLDNQMYECIGGTPTLTALGTDISAMAAGAGFPRSVSVETVEEFESSLSAQLDDAQLGLIVAKIEPGGQRWEPHQHKRTDGVEDKYAFIRHVEALEGIDIHLGTPVPKPTVSHPQHTLTTRSDW
jgi:sulfopyruvate decarboxylase subunit beta